jgi:hypothetical protein
MIALHDNSQVYGTYPEGGWFTLPNGDRVSPAFSGWTGDDDLQLSEIAAADPVPSGKISTGQTAQMVEGVPKWVHSLEDVLPSSTDPMDYPLSALEFDAALVRIGIEREAVAPAIKQIFAGDIDAMADSLARWWNLQTMTRDNEVMGLLKPVFNVTDAQIDAAWMATVARRGA